ncbi:MAG: hypothetical protein J7J70_05140, partial [Deltaproteobacteria bacterium]|nr:hypothetical protein [Candidatus Tharpellaceae bacterium]
IYPRLMWSDIPWCRKLSLPMKRLKQKADGFVETPSSSSLHTIKRDINHSHIHADHKLKNTKGSRKNK